MDILSKPIKVLKKIKYFLKGYRIINYYKVTHKSYVNDGKSNYAIVNLDSFMLNKDMGRYSFIFSQYLGFSGFKMVIKLDKPFFYQPARYKDLLLNQDYTYVRSVDTPINTIKLCSAEGSCKVIELAYGYDLLNKQSEVYQLPYMLHPNFYKEKITEEFFNDKRNANKKVKIFFSGNADVRFYNRITHQNRFSHILSRVNVLNFLKDKYKNDSVLEIITDENQLYEKLDSQDIANKIIISEGRIASDKWLEILSKSDFFICLPGVGMPWAHNAFEAISVGAIPIIQYGSLLTPPLVHMQNCIAYNSLEEFDRAIEIALNLNGLELTTLKINVTSYFDQFIAPDVITNKITAFFNSQEKNLKVVIPYFENPA